MQTVYLHFYFYEFVELNLTETYMPRILFIAAHRPNRSPSQRFRFEQYFSFLRQNGYVYFLSYLISEKNDQLFYKPGSFHSKLYIFFRSALKRRFDVWRCSKFDIVFIQREAFMTGSTYFARQMRKKNVKFVYDFDDAIWHFDVSEGNKNLGWLKNPGKTVKLISMADVVIAGNKYLADYAKHHNENVIIIPTTIDTDYHRKINFSNTPKNKICIGWTGSITTIKHFEHAVPLLKKLKDKYQNKIEIKVIGDVNYTNESIGVKGIEWNSETEIEDLSTIDIGIMPLPNDEWTKGKCGLKGLSYMAMEIPSVMSPVGVNTEIIQDGINGFLADTDEEWIAKLSLLIESQELREKIGKEARKTVIEKYSVESQQQRYLDCFNALLKR